jgi:hypothetical protein
MLGVLVVILGRNGVARPGFGKGKLKISLIVPFGALIVRRRTAHQIDGLPVRLGAECSYWSMATWLSEAT